MSVALAFCVASSVASSSSAAVSHGAELLLPLLAHLAHEGEAIRGGHLAHRIGSTLSRVVFIVAAASWTALAYLLQACS